MHCCLLAQKLLSYRTKGGIAFLAVVVGLGWLTDMACTVPHIVDTRVANLNGMCELG